MKQCRRGNGAAVLKGIRNTLVTLFMGGGQGLFAFHEYW